MSLAYSHVLWRTQLKMSSLYIYYVASCISGFTKLSLTRTFWYMKIVSLMFVEVSDFSDISHGNRSWKFQNSWKIHGISFFLKKVMENSNFLFRWKVNRTFSSVFHVHFSVIQLYGNCSRDGLLNLSCKKPIIFYWLKILFPDKCILLYLNYSLMVMQKCHHHIWYWQNNANFFMILNVNSYYDTLRNNYIKSECRN